MKLLANAIYLNTAQVNKNSVPKMCSNETPRNVKEGKLIAIRARVDPITTSAKFYGDRQERHPINATIRTQTEVDMETADTID